MNWYYICGGIVVLVIGVLLFTNAGRYVKTFLLIARVSPYEQPGGGAGSIYVIGDSTGYGTGATRSADSVAGRLGNDYTWYRIQNNSVNGRLIAGALEAANTLSGEYDLILLQIGANDLIAGRSVEAVVADMQQLIDTTRSHAAHVIVLSSGNIGAVPAFSGEDAARLERASRQYTRSMLELANRYQDVNYVPLFDEPSEDPFVADPDRYTAIDGLHPTSAGYAIWYEKAQPYFDQVLEQR